MGRPRKYFTEEERRQANRRSNTKYMVNKEWLCPDCGNRDYSLAGIWTHLKSKKHIRNATKIYINSKKIRVNRSGYFPFQKMSHRYIAFPYMPF